MSPFTMANVIPLFSSQIRRPIVRSLTLGLLTCVGVLVSAPQLSTHSNHGFTVGQPAHAQSQTSFSGAEVRNYALAVLDIETLRQQRSDDIAAILNVETLPAIACNDPDSLQGMNRAAREMVVEFCNSAIEIVESHDLSIGQFNIMTELMQSDQDLQERVYEELIDLQTSSASSQR